VSGSLWPARVASGSKWQSTRIIYSME